MSELAYIRSDGVTFIVAESGRVYEVRPVGLTVDMLEAQARAGLLRKDGDSPAAGPARPQPAAAKRMQLATSRHPRTRPAAVSRGPLALVRG